MALGYVDLRYIIVFWWSLTNNFKFEFVNQLSANPANVVFALVRNLDTTAKLKQLGRNNVHILQADVTDYNALKVRDTASRLVA